MDGCMDGCMDGWTDSRMDAWMDAWMDGQIVGWMHGWTDSPTSFVITNRRECLPKISASITKKPKSITSRN